MPPAPVWVGERERVPTVTSQGALPSVTLDISSSEFCRYALRERRMSRGSRGAKCRLRVSWLPTEETSVVTLLGSSLQPRWQGRGRWVGAVLYSSRLDLSLAVAVAVDHRRRRRS